MEFLKYAIIGIMVALALQYVNRSASNKPEVNSDQNSILRIHRLYQIFGYIGLAFGLAFLGGSIFTEQETNVLVLMILVSSFFIFMGLAALVLYHRHKVTFDETRIKYYSIFGSQGEINFDEIENISFNPFTSYITISNVMGKKVKLHQHLVGIKHLLDKINKEEINKGRVRIPHLD